MAEKMCVCMLRKLGGKNRNLLVIKSLEKSCWREPSSPYKRFVLVVSLLTVRELGVGTGGSSVSPIMRFAFLTCPGCEESFPVHPCSERAVEFAEVQMFCQSVLEIRR